MCKQQCLKPYGFKAVVCVVRPASGSMQQKNVTYITYVQAALSNHVFFCLMIVYALQAQHQDLNKQCNIDHICASRRAPNRFKSFCVHCKPRFTIYATSIT